jgi:salicylate hydroxylase
VDSEYVQTAPHWVEGKIALMGDACHPMLPYVAQGAAQAVEDAGVLTEVFTRTSDVDLALAVYELVEVESHHVDLVSRMLSHDI